MQNRITVALQRTNQLKCHTHARKLFKFGRAVFAVGIDNSHRIGQLFARRMVVGNDHIHPEFFGKRDFLQRRNTVIDRHNQPNAAFRKFAHCRTRNAIALTHTVGNAVLDICPLRHQIRIQKRRRSHAVGVIIAENGNAFKILHRGGNALHRFFHIGKSERVKVLYLRRQERFRLRFVGQPAGG